MTVAKGGIHTLGKYRVIAELARGGMGVVHLALLRRPGASTLLLVLKVLKPEMLEEPAVLTMFMQEGRLAACLNHPNVVRTFEAGSDGLRPYIAMEYLDGQPLHRVLSRARKNGKPVPLELQGAVLCSALEGLAYAHTAVDGDGKPMGIVHRDMSPHNVFICYDGQVKVLDFGIAKAVNSWVDTRAGVLKGKIPYMSPEQAAGGHVDARADVFAVGVMLWEAATGRRFWSGVGTDVEILRAMSQGNLSAKHDGAMDEVHEDLRAVILKATALDPSRRHASAEELLKELRSALGQRRVPPSSQQEIGRFVDELFADDRARLQLAIKEALRFQTQTVSGEYPVSHLRGRFLANDSTEADSLTPDHLLPNAAILPQARSTNPPPLPVPTPAAVRQGLLASAEEIGLAVRRLQESERMAALPQSVEAIVRAVHAVGGHDVATTLETLSDCMDVVQSFEAWRLSVAEHLRSLEADESVTELIDFEPAERLPTLAETLPAGFDDVAAVAEPDVRGPVEAVDRVQPIETMRPSVIARRPGLAAFALLALLAVLATAAWVGTHVTPAKPRALATQAVSFAAPVAAAAVATASDKPRAAENVHLTVRASPAQTRIVIDGLTVLENPCVVMLPRDGATHTMHVESDGYASRDESFDANGDRTFVVALEPLKLLTRPAGPGRIAAPPIAPPPPPVTGSVNLPTAPGDKCYLGRSDKPRTAPGDLANDAHPANHVSLPSGREESP